MRPVMRLLSLGVAAVLAAPVVASSQALPDAAVSVRGAGVVRGGPLGTDFGNCGVFTTGYERDNTPHEERLTEVVDVLAVGGAVRLAGADVGGVRVVALDENGRLDRGYGSGGAASVPLPVSEAGPYLRVYAAAVAPTGEVVVAAMLTEDSGASDIALVRLDADGNPDPGFSGDGVHLYDLDRIDAPEDIAVAPNGTTRVLVTTTDDDGNAAATILSVRPDGSADTAFGADGIVTYQPVLDQYGQGLAVDDQGRTVAVTDTYGSSAERRRHVIRLTPAGDLDGSFGSGGVVDLEPLGVSGFERAVVATPDGITLAAGILTGGPMEPALLRLDGTGAPDAAFGGDGIVPLELPDPGLPLVRLAAAGDRVYVATDASAEKTGPQGTYFLDTVGVEARGPDGGLVPAFGGDGTVVLADVEEPFRAVGIAAASDGGVFVGGPYNGGSDFAAARLLPDGSLQSACRTGQVLVDRVWGENRFATAAALSQATFVSARVVYVATGMSFPDALAAGPVAAQQGAPLLLVDRDRVPAETAAELARLQPDEIIVVGGPGVVSASVEASLGAYGAVRRIFGQNRYETAAALSADAFEPGLSTVFVATGENFPDALAVGPAAGRLGGPILLTSRGGLPDATRNELSRLRPEQIVVVGGDTVIPYDQELELGDYASFVAFRVSGRDRYETASAIISNYFQPYADYFGDYGVTPGVYISTGANFPDALAAGPVAALDGLPIVLTPRESLGEVSRETLARLNFARAFVVGGTGAISAAIEDVLDTPEMDYTYLASAFDGSPVRWDPCSPIPWVFNPAGAPPGGLELITMAVQRIEAVTGVDWVYEGTTDEPVRADRELYQPSRYGDRFAPAIIGWTPFDAGGGVGGTIGYGGFASVSAGGSPEVAVTGFVMLDTNWVGNPEEPSRDFADGISWGSIVMHELGHAMGLDHIGSDADIMYPFTRDESRALYGPGDERGLQRLYVGAECVPVPPANLFGSSVRRFERH